MSTSTPRPLTPCKANASSTLVAVLDHGPSCAHHTMYRRSLRKPKTHDASRGQTPSASLLIWSSMKSLSFTRSPASMKWKRICELTKAGPVSNPAQSCGVHGNATGLAHQNDSAESWIQPTWLHPPKWIQPTWLHPPNAVGSPDLAHSSLHRRFQNSTYLTSCHARLHGLRAPARPVTDSSSNDKAERHSCVTVGGKETSGK